MKSKGLIYLAILIPTVLIVGLVILFLFFSPVGKGGNCPGMTYTQYEQIAPGMDLEQVINIIGEEPSRNASHNHTRMYIWQCGQKIIQVQFEEEKVTEKSQMGLE